MSRSKRACRELGRCAATASAALLALSLAACSERVASEATALELSRITIGSNPPGTSYYAVGGGIAKLIQEELGVQATVRPFAGSSVYLPLLQRGELPLGLNTGIDSYFAFSASDIYEAPMPNLRLLISLWPIRHSYLVRADSGMRSIEDLRGRRVVTDLSANAFLGPYHRAILATAGLTDSDLEPINTGGLPDGLRLLTQGRADATPASIDLALVRQAHTTIAGGIRYLTLGSVDGRAPEAVPGASVAMASPTAVTTGFDAPMLLPQFHTYLNTSTALADADAHAIARLVYEHWDALQRDFPVLAETGRDALVPADVPVPYHAGAIAYYREAGLWSERHQANQDHLLEEIH
jgi:TRAP transporter TAXI family solute receptor